MTLNLIKRTAFIILVVVSIASCKKDKMDLLVGVWDLNSFKINGHDTTAAIKSQSCYVKWDFHKEDDKGYFKITGYFGDTACPCFGNYNLINDDKELRLSFGVSPFMPVGACRDTVDISWKIRNMSETDLILVVSSKHEVNEMWLKKD
jgi:hypothetical protein